MASLSYTERLHLEKFLDMAGGYVLGFSNATFGQFVGEAVGLDIHDERYQKHGTSKANKLRGFWEVEDDYVVGCLLKNLVECGADRERFEGSVERCQEIVARLLAGGPLLIPVKSHANQLNANHLKDQIRRLEDAVQSDPALAIGTAKELVETYCRTILAERGITVEGTPDLSALTKQTFKELNLVPKDVPDAARGADVVRRILSNLSTIGQGMAELRNLYGSGHGRHGHAKGLTARHARLAVGAAVALVVFLFETHQEKQSARQQT